MALALDIAAAALALAAYIAGVLLVFGRRQRLALPLIRPTHFLSPSSRDNEACHVRATAGR